MNKKLILLTVIAVFTTSLVAAEFEAAKEPSKILTKEDLNLIDGAIASDFKGLSKAEKKKLKDFLADYKGSAKKEKLTTKPGKKGKGSIKSKTKGIKKYKAGSITK